MEILSNINQSEVFEGVFKITGYTGKNIPEEKAFDSVVATTDEESLLADFWNDTISELLCELKRYKPVLEEKEEGATFKFELPESFDSNGVSCIENSLCSYVVNRICAKWFYISKKDEVAYYERECANLLVRIGRLLNARCTSVRRKQSPF